LRVSRHARLAAGASAAGLGLGAVGFLAARHRLWRRPLPQTEGTITVAGIGGPVQISRDRFGVPHINAEHRDDLWFGQGFANGQDRLGQLDFYRRAVEGRVAEIAGAEGLAIDRFMRTLGIARICEREQEELDPGLRRELDAFCAGLNAAAEQARALPFEMQLLRLRWEPWRPADMLGVAKLLAFALSTNWERELLRADMVRALGPELTARLEPPYPATNPIVVQEPWSGDGASLVEQIDHLRDAIGMSAEAGGSNNWAVSGARSVTGTPLIAGDPHLTPSMPPIWYQVGLSQGGRSAHGASLPGIPGIAMGQTDDVAWTFTNVMPDNQDLFIERIEGERYLFEGEWRPLEIHDEEIAVKGRSEPERLRVRATHHGPIVNDFLGADGEEPLALAWTVFDAPGVTPTHTGILDVTDGAELHEILRHYTSPVSNMIWADRESIGYKLVGQLPLRRGGCPDVPKPGWSGEFEWEGTIPYDELPELTDPGSGYLVTANNRITGDDYPHHITSDYLDGYRALRITQLIEAEPEHDLASFQRMQGDLLSLPGIEVARRLSRLRPSDQREESALERLRSWDGRMAPDSIAASIYQAFILRLGREFIRAVVRDRDIAERWLDRASNGFLDHVTSPWRWHSHLLSLWEEGDEELIGRSWDGLALDALRGALDDLSDQFGPRPESWRWGEVHEMEFPHPLGDANPILRRLLNRRLRAGGAQETVSQIAYDPNNPYRAVWAPSWRMVADAAVPGRSRWQMFSGQSGHPGSEHYDDLQADWLEGRTQPMAGEGPWRRLTLQPSA